MNDFYGLLLVLIALYLSECLCWAPEGAQAFRGRAGKWRVNAPLMLLPALKKNIQVAPVLPASGGIALCELRPAPLSPDGFVIDGSESLPFETLETLEADGAVVKRNGEVLVRAGTGAYALHLVKLAEELRAMAPGQRGARIQAELTRSLNVSAARRRHAHCARLERFLKWQCRLLFLIIFVLFPPIAYFRGFLAVLPLIVFALALLAHTLWLFNRTHRALYRGKDTGRRAHVAEMALMPLAAMRAPDRLRREALGQFHWLAVLSAIAPADEARELAARALRNLEFMPAVDDNGNSSAGWLRREWRQAVWRHIDQLYGDPRKLLVAPARRFPESVSYCPCCCEEYRLPEGICQDCSGVELRAFGEAG